MVTSKALTHLIGGMSNFLRVAGSIEEAIVRWSDESAGQIWRGNARMDRRYFLSGPGLFMCTYKYYDKEDGEEWQILQARHA